MNSTVTNELKNRNPNPRPTFVGLITGALRNYDAVNTADNRASYAQPSYRFNVSRKTLSERTTNKGINLRLTRENFKEIMGRLQRNDPRIGSLEIVFELKTQELDKLHDMIVTKGNTELGYILWHKDQTDRNNKLRQIEHKLIDNNKSYRYHPIDYVHALLSKHVYKNSSQGSPVTLDSSIDGHLENWVVEKVYDYTSTSGYYGVIYKNDKTHQIVLAVRGTNATIGILLNKKSSLKTDFEEVLRNKILPEQQKQNFEATQDAVRIAKDTGYRLSLTGHSLGAWLAELGAFFCHAVFDYTEIKAVTFDGPGTKQMMKTLQSNNGNRDRVELENIDIVSYLASPNPVNCCNAHVGKIYMVKTQMKLTEWLQARAKEKSSFNEFKFVFAIEGHWLSGIIETFDPTTGTCKCIRMLDWPKIEYIGDKTISFASKGAIVVETIIHALVSQGVSKIEASQIAPRIVPVIQPALNAITPANLQNHALTNHLITFISQVIAYALARAGIPYVNQAITKVGQGIVGVYAMLNKNPQAGQFARQAMGDIVEDTTIMTIIGLLQSCYEGEIDSKQGMNFYQYIEEIDVEKEDEVERKKIPNFHNRFEIITLAKYRPGEDTHIMKLTERERSVDNFLAQLERYRHKEAIQKLPSIIQFQINDLLQSFTIIIKSTVSNTQHKLIPNQGYDIAGIQQRALRLIDVIPADVIEEWKLNISKSEDIENRSVKDQLTHLSHLPPVPLGYLVIKGKEEELENKLGLHQVVIIGGKRGVGKRTLATKYGHAATRKNVIVLWLECDKIQENFIRLANAFNISINYQKFEKTIDAVYAELARFDKEKKILFIFNDVENKEEISPYLDKRPNRVQVIITTINDNLLNGTSAIVQLEGFNNDQAKLYLKQAHESRLIQHKLNDDDCQKLVDTVGVSPYRLSKTVAYLNDHPEIGVPEYIKLYMKCKIGHKKNEKIYPEIELLLEKVNPASLPLLYYLAYLDPSGVSLKLMLVIMEKKEEDLEQYVDELKKSSLISAWNENDQRILKVDDIARNEVRTALAIQNKSHDILAQMVSALDKALTKELGKPHMGELISYAKMLISEAKGAIPPIDGIENLLQQIVNLILISNYKEALLYKKELLELQKVIYGANRPTVADSLADIGFTYWRYKEEEENIRPSLEYNEAALKMRKELFRGNNWRGNHEDIATSLNDVGIAYEALGDKDKALEYYKQACSIYSILLIDYGKQLTKSNVECYQPDFFTKQGLRPTLQEQDYIGGNIVGFECRWIITSHGKVKANDDLLSIKQKIQKDVLNDIAQAVDNYGWSSWGVNDWGVKGYIEKGYLNRKLGEFGNNDKNIEIAQMLCFESMNLGIMKSEKKPYEVAENFTQNNPELVKKIAIEHPEFFVDGSIVEACVRAMPNDEFQKHILEHVKYMGMEERRIQFSKAKL